MDAKKSHDRPKRRGRWTLKKKLAVAGIVFLVLLLLAPSIISRTPVFQALVNRYAPIQGSIQFKHARLGWFSNLRIEGMEILGPSGEKMISCTSLNLSRSLLGLIFRGVNHAKVEIHQPVVEVNVANGELNLASLVGESDSGADAIDLEIEIKNGELRFTRDEETISVLSSLNSKIQLSSVGDSTSQSIILELGNSEVEGAIAAGTFHFSCEYQADPGSPIGVRLNANQLSLDFVNCFRSISGLPEVSTELSGLISIDSEGLPNEVGADDFASEKRVTNWEIHLAGCKLESNATSNLLVEGMPCPPFGLDGKLQIGAQGIQPDLEIDSKYVIGKLKGTLPRDLFKVSPDQESLQLNARIDVARFANDYPQMVSLLPDTQLESGTVELTSFLRNEGGRHRFLVDLRCEDVAALKGTEFGMKSIRWQKPLKISAAINWSPDDTQFDSNEIALEYAEVKSEFMALTGAGNLTNGSVTFHSDFDLLSQRLSQFFDLGDFRMAGTSRGKVDWNQPAAETGRGDPVDGRNSDILKLSKFTGNLSVDHLLLAFGADSKLSEPRAELSFEAVLSKKGKRYQLDNSTLNGIVGTGGFSIKPARPVQLENPAFERIGFQFQGDAQKWIERISMFADISFLDLHGKADVAGRIHLTDDAIQVVTRKLNIDSFSMELGSFVLSDPVARGELDFVYRFDVSQFKASLIRVKTGTMHLESTNLRTTEREGESVLLADVAIAADLHRASRWFPMKGQRFGGTAVLQGKIDSSDSGLVMTANGKIEQFKIREVLSPSKTGEPVARDGERRLRFEDLFQEEEVRLQVNCSLPPDYSRIDVDKLGLATPGHSATIKGTVGLSGASHIELDGELQTDLDRLSRQLKSLTSDMVRFKGKGVSRFDLKGALIGPASGKRGSPASPSQESALRGDAVLDFGRGEVFDLPFEKGVIDVRVRGTQLEISSRQMVIGKGRLMAKPSIDFSRENLKLMIPRGAVLKNAEIEPEVFGSWLGYVAPLLEDATEAKGKFSIDLHRNLQIPFQNPGRINGKGAITVHQMEVGPGPHIQSVIPLVQQVLALLNKQELLSGFFKSPKLIIPPQEIEIEMKEGRVWHRQLVLQMGKVYLVTSGSVGVDQQVDLQLGIPIADDWFSGRPAMRSILGKAISIRVRGTISRPRIDTGGITQLVKQAAKNAAKDIIGAKADELLKGRLFKNPLFKEIDKNLMDGKAGDLMKDELLNRLRNFGK